MPYTYCEQIGAEIRDISDEIPFDIPESWEWVRISFISSIVTKGTTPRGGNVSYMDNGVGFLRAENIAGLDKLSKINLNCIDEETHNNFLKRSILKENDILITIAGTLGRTAIVRKEDLPLNANQAVSIIRLVNSCEFDLLYLVFALNSPIIQKILTEQKKITAIPNLTLEIISDCLLPIPPISEQHRIVTKIEELLPYIEKYEQSETQLTALNANFPELLKKSILQEAVQGKLVPQSPDDEPASVLLDRIRAEKQALIKAGKIKKDKHESVIITRDKIPYELPKNWTWCTLNDVVIQIADIDHKMPTTVEMNGYPYISPLDFTETGIDYNNAKMISKEDFDKLSAKIKPKRNDIIFPRYGTIGVIRLVDTDMDFLVSYSCCTIQNTINMNYLYVYYVLQSTLIKLEISKYINKTTQPNVGLKSIKNFLFPLPPLSEQKRIVTKIEELMKYCEML